MNKQTETWLMRLPDVLTATGLKRSTLFNLIAKGEFSKGVLISERCRAWSSESVNDWIQSKLKEVA